MAKGAGKTEPKVVDKKIVRQYPYFKEGTKLTLEFIESLENEEQKEMAHQINRRTDFKVLSTNYK